VVYGDELDTGLAGTPGTWKIVCREDENYGRKGLNPLAVHRKSKVNNTNNNWDYRLDHWLFLKLPHPMQEGKEYTLKISRDLKAGARKESFTYDNFSNESESVHVNIIGYTPDSPVKSADLYYWMGDGGQRDYSGFEGNSAWVLNVETGEKEKVGTVAFWKDDDLEAEALGRNLTGSDVWNADFTGFSRPGTYRLVVEGVGCSAEFAIKKDVYFEPFKTSLRGYYYMRIGEDRMDMEPVPRRPLFIPGKDPEGFTVYLTDLHPYHPDWKKHRGDTWDEPHFKPARESMFWAHRLPGNPTNPNAFGGHSDALDWDRHLGHVSNIYDLLYPYLLTGGKPDRDDLDIGESGNGIPDILDEARNEVDFWLRLRHGDAYAHGLTNPSSEKTVMFQAGTTTMAAWANAANCAMMAECFRLAGEYPLVEYYKDEAVKAYEFAMRQEDRQLDDHQDIGDARMRGRDFRMMAAAFLYSVTGERRWEDIMAEESVADGRHSLIENRREWVQTWGTAAYLLTGRERHYPYLYQAMETAVFNQAMENNVRHMDLRPSRRSSNNNYWQTAQNLHLVMLAHAISEEEPDRELFEKAMILEADWGLGRNPGNIVEMTGLGERHIVNCYTSGRNDGSPGLHPGHTPYNNLDPWGGNHNGSNPRWFTEKCYPDWEEGGWPHQEGHFNCRYSWANAEFTPRQTMRGKMALYGYLYAIL
jgi:endoglucanase